MQLISRTRTFFELLLVTFIDKLLVESKVRYQIPESTKFFFGVKCDYSFFFSNNSNCYVSLSMPFSFPNDNNGRIHKGRLKRLYFLNVEGFLLLLKFGIVSF